MAATKKDPMALENLIWDDPDPGFTMKPGPQLCDDCSRELCAELDQYYGTDPSLVNLCDRCRRKRKKR